MTSPTISIFPILKNRYYGFPNIGAFKKCHEKTGKKSLDLAKGSLLNFEVKKQGEDGPAPSGLLIPHESSTKSL